MRIENIGALAEHREKARAAIEAYSCRILVCSGNGCMASGAQKVYDEFSRLLEGMGQATVEMQKDLPHIGTLKTGCQGLCEYGTLVRIEPYDYQYVKVKAEDCAEIVEETVKNGRPVERLFHRSGEETYVHPMDIPFLNKQTRIVLENCGNIDAESLDEYIAAGGFSAFVKAV